MRSRTKLICPRCYSQGYLSPESRAGSQYLYVIHVSKRSRSKCYLGPLRYSAGSKFNPIQLAGASDPARFLRYLLRSLDLLENQALGLTPARAREWSSKLELVQAKLSELKRILQGIGSKENRNQ